MRPEREKKATSYSRQNENGSSSSIEANITLEQYKNFKKNKTTRKKQQNLLKQNSNSNLTFKSNPESLNAKESKDNVSSSRRKVGVISSSKNLKLPPIYDRAPSKYNVVELAEDSSHHHSHQSHSVQNHAHTHDPMQSLGLAMFPEFKKNLKNRVMKY